MSDPQPSPEPRALGPLCREVLRDPSLDFSDAPELRAHVEQCSVCRARMTLRRGLAAELRRRPAVPAELRRLSFVEGIHERVVEHAEASAHGRWLAAGMPVVDAAATVQAATPLLESPLMESRVSRDLVTSPPPLSAGAWSRVRSSILQTIEADSARASGRIWKIGLGCAAAAAIVCAALLVEGTRTAPNIVFVDLEHVPGVDLAALRSGIPR
jgi:hypothetical protein